MLFSGPVIWGLANQHQLVSAVIKGHQLELAFYDRLSDKVLPFRLIAG